MAAGYSTPSVKRTFDILYAIAKSKTGMNISELSRSLKINKSTVHGITLALENINVIIKDGSSKKYKLGISIIELARFAHTQTDLREIAKPSMEKLAKRVQETVLLGVLNHENVTVLDIVEAENPVTITSTIGSTNPVLGGATGKTVLATMDEEQIVDIIKSNGLKNYTKNSIIDTEKFLQEIQKVKKQGYAIDDEEYVIGSYAIGVPIKGPGALTGNIVIVGLTERMRKKKKILIKAIMDAAEEISHRQRELHI